MTLSNIFTRKQFLLVLLLTILLTSRWSPVIHAASDDDVDNNGVDNLDDDGDDTEEQPFVAPENPEELKRIKQVKDAAEKILQKRKRKKGGLFKKTREVSLSTTLFPGMTPKEFFNKQRVNIWVDEVTSPKSPIPFRYIDLPEVCPSFKDNYLGIVGGERKRPERSHIKNLGERLKGRHVQRPAPYKVEVQQNLKCTKLCTVELKANDIKKYVKLIKRLYTVNLSIDGLPVYVKARDFGVALRGYPLGAQLPVPIAKPSNADPGAKSVTGAKSVARATQSVNNQQMETKYFLYNHLRFSIEINEYEANKFHIIGFSVKPISFDHQAMQDRKKEQGPKNENAGLLTCSPSSKSLNNAPFTLLELAVPKGKESLSVHYTYEIEWVKVNTQWADRWDVYLLGLPDDSLAHHMSVMNSFMVTLFLSVVVCVVLIKNLRKDIAAYNEFAVSVTLEDARLDEEETGWKLVHGDVFRPPNADGAIFFGPMGLSILVGSGCQICVAVLLTLILGIMRVLNPMKKGQALSTIVMLYAFSGIVAGYVSSRLYKFSGGKDWKRNTVLTAIAFPGFILSLFILLNICLSFANAASAVSFGMVVGIFLIWTCISTPLVLVGAFIGYKRDAIKVPTKTNQIARIVPKRHWCFSTNIISLVIGALPFSTVCIEIYFMMGAVWLHQFYYLLGYLLASVIMLGIVSALMSTLLCYVRLCSEDHRWWWKSYADSFTAGVWLFIYSVWYFGARLKLMGFLPVVVYFTYMFVVSVAFGMYCGAIGFLASLWFTKTIYGAIKID